MFNTIAVNDEDGRNCDICCWQVNIVSFGSVVVRIVGLRSGVDAGCFQHSYTDFGQTKLGMPKLNLK